MLIYRYANVPHVQHCVLMYTFDHTQSWKKWPWRCCLGFILPTEFIHSVCSVPAAAAGLKIKLAKQINHMMRSLADCCCFFPPLHFIGIFSFLPSWSCSFLATRVPVDSTRCSRQHTSPLSASWNIHGQPGTAAKHHAAQTRDHLFINFISLLPGCLRHNNCSTYKRSFSPFCVCTASFFFCCVSVLWREIPPKINMLDFIYLWIIRCLSPPSLLFLCSPCVSFCAPPPPPHTHTLLLGRWVGCEWSSE